MKTLWSTCGAATLLVVGTILGCGGGGPEPDPDGDGGTDPTISCQSVGLEQTTARPFERIGVTIEFDGDAPDAMAAEVHHPSLDEPYYARIEGEAEAGYTLTTPIHPTGTGGGPVQLQVAGDNVDCPQRISLTIEALPDNPGVVADTVSEMQTLLRKQVALLGRDASVLEADDPTDVPEPLWGSAIAETILGAEDYDYSMRRLLEGRGADIPDLQEGLRIADALLAEAGYPQMMTEAKQRLEAIPDPGFDPEYRRAMGQGQGALMPEGSSGIEPRTRRLAACPEPLRVYFGNNPGALSHYMRVAEYARSSLNSEAYKKMEDVLTAASMVPSGPLQAVATVVGVLVTSQAQSWKAMANTLPSTLIEPEVDVTVTDFEEDADYTGEWRDYKVRAKSNGWNPTSLMLENLWTAFERVVAAKGLSSRLVKASDDGILSDGFLQNAKSNLEGEARSKWFEKVGESKVCYVSPQYWGPVDLTDPVYSEHEYRLSIQQAAGSRRRYEPADTGRGVVAVHADPAVFPPASNELASLATRQINVNEIEITLYPSPDAMEPGEKLKIRARVEHAVDPSVEWETSVGSITQTQSSNVAGDQFATLTAPQDIEDFPIIVRVRSTASRGLRGGGASIADPRYGWGYYVADERITLRPGTNCLEEGASYELVSEVYGHPDEVTWSVSGGRISPNGDGRATYTGTEEGTHRITVTSDVKPSLTTSGRVKVGPCECSGSAQWSGTFSGSIGTFGNVNYLPSPAANTIQILIEDDFSNGSVSIQFPGTELTPGEHAAFIIATSDGSFGPSTIGFYEDGSSASLNVFHFSEHYFKASFSATFEPFKTVFTEDPMPVTLTGIVEGYHFVDVLEANLEGRTCQTTEPPGR